MLRIGDNLPKSDQSVSSGKYDAVVSVIPLFTLPGATATARRPCLPYSRASA